MDEPCTWASLDFILFLQHAVCLICFFCPRFPDTAASQRRQTPKFAGTKQNEAEMVKAWGLMSLTLTIIMLMGANALPRNGDLPASRSARDVEEVNIDSLHPKDDAQDDDEAEKRGLSFAANHLRK